MIVDQTPMGSLEQSDGTRKVLTGMDGLRLLCAFQALCMPSGFYRVTHTRARQVIEETTGKKVKRGAKPVRPDGSRCSTLVDYMEWHGFVLPEGEGVDGS